jgi:hypothetical protein
LICGLAEEVSEEDIDLAQVLGGCRAPGGALPLI